MRQIVVILLIQFLYFANCSQQDQVNLNPLPTADQVIYQNHEIMALIHFNMGTYAHEGDPCCDASNWDVKADYASGKTNDPATFNPVKFNVSNWIESMNAVGAKHAVLTAKHGCGFLLWPTKATLPNGTDYDYCVGKEKSAIKFDVLKEFSETMKANGLGHGFYYSLTNNFYLNVLHHYVSNSTLLPGQVKVTQEEFEAIALAQVSELWENYGSLQEIWFDGGYTSDMKTEIIKLIKNQPDADVFGGTGVSKNPLCWVGTETGLPNGEIWSTGNGMGDANSSLVCPKACDTVMQNPRAWFWQPGRGTRSLSDLINVYHETVGRNCVIELDFAVDRDGLIAENQAVQYKAFGDWIKGCYLNGSVAQTSGNGTTFTVDIPSGSTIDRVVIQEDIAQGYRIREYTVEYNQSGQWKSASTGHSVGNKRIDLFEAAVKDATQVRLTVSDSVATPIIKNFAVHVPCSSGIEETIVE